MENSKIQIPKNQKVDKGSIGHRRRQILISGLLGGGACLLRASLFGGALGILAPRAASAAVPANNVRLSDFGGVPGASPSALINAFNGAFARLKSLGGGTLTVAPGVYNLGGMGNATAITVNDLQNVVVSGYGAQLTMTTNTSPAYPNFMWFNNPHNVTIAGLSFKDFGTDLGTKNGATCIVVQSTMPRAGFTTVDCVADNVIQFFATNQSNSFYTFEGFDIHATVINSYYGISANRNGRYSKCNLICTNVRRAFVSHGARNWDINVKTNRTGGLGSNAHVVLVPFPDAPVQDVNINVAASGDLSGYLGVVSICHQGTAGVYSYARNVKIKIAISGATGAATSGFVTFTAEPPGSGALQPSTVCGWEQIEITGSVVGAYGGAIVSNISRSSASTNSIFVASNLAGYQNMTALPTYFRVFTPAAATPTPTPVPTATPAPTATPTPAPTPTPTPTPVSISGLQVTNNWRRIYIKYAYSGAIVFHRLFLDTDGNALTGFRKNGIGANFLIENGVLYRYSGVNGAWGWTYVARVDFTSTTNSVGISVLRRTLGRPNSVRVIAEIAAATRTAVSPIVQRIF